MHGVQVTQTQSKPLRCHLYFLLLLLLALMARFSSGIMPPSQSEELVNILR